MFGVFKKKPASTPPALCLFIHSRFGGEMRYSLTAAVFFSKLDTRERESIARAREFFILSQKRFTKK
jgi:hypothetical protein